MTVIDCVLSRKSCTQVSCLTANEKAVLKSGQQQQGFSLNRIVSYEAPRLKPVQTIMVQTVTISPIELASNCAVWTWLEPSMVETSWNHDGLNQLEPWWFKPVGTVMVWWFKPVGTISGLHRFEPKLFGHVFFVLTLVFSSSLNISDRLPPDPLTPSKKGNSYHSDSKNHRRSVNDCEKIV